jgi:hypothetical protein
MKRTKEFEELQKTYVNVNKLLDVIMHHIEKEDCQHCMDYLTEGMEERNE